MSVRFVTLVFGLMIVNGAAWPSAQSPTLKTAMREKLVNTQQLLEAVVTADYGGIERYAERLSRISYTEIASWQSAQEPEYVKQATAFLLSVKGLREAAASRSIESATSEYTALVSSCIQCHKRARKSRVVSLTPPSQALPGMPGAPH
jgi:cytochrome c553